MKKKDARIQSSHESPDNVSGNEGLFERLARPAPRGQSYGGTGGMVKGLPEDAILKLRRESLRKGF